MTLGRRMAALLVAAISVVAMMQVPALAHHKDGHGGGGPSPSPSPTQSPTPTPTPTPTAGDDDAAPCATTGPIDESQETWLSCSAVSADGMLEIRGAVVKASTAQPDICLTWECGGYWPSDARFAVGVDTGSGFEYVCVGSTDSFGDPVDGCAVSVSVPTGTPVECIIRVRVDDPSSWTGGVAEVSCL